MHHLELLPAFNLSEIHMDFILKNLLIWLSRVFCILSYTLSDELHVQLLQQHDFISFPNLLTRSFFYPKVLFQFLHFIDHLALLKSTLGPIHWKYPHTEQCWFIICLCSVGRGRLCLILTSIVSSSDSWFSSQDLTPPHWPFSLSLWIMHKWLTNICIWSYLVYQPQSIYLTVSCHCQLHDLHYFSVNLFRSNQ